MTSPLPLAPIEDLWKAFEARVMPLDAPAIQRREMRIAFYAGFKAMLDMAYLLGELPDESAVAMIGMYENECQAFARAA
jgi:hypothetical protein